MKNILKELRVKHYIKNVLVFLPLVFSLGLLDLRQAGLAALVFAAFCLGSSGVYVINDIADTPRDRLHPTKRLRPIASGAISTRQGVVMASVCLAASLALAFIAGAEAALTLACYVLLNIGYSFALKRYAIVDVFCVMAGFLLRIWAGAVAISVPVSSWLLLTVMSLSLYLGFGKRRSELVNSEGDGNPKTRVSLSRYSAGFLDKATTSMLTLSLAFYALWAIDPATAEHLNTDKLVWTIPLVAAGLLRYAQLLEDGGEGDPTGVILTDKPIRAVVLIYVAAVVAMIYIQ